MNILSLLTKTKLENIIKYSFLNFKSYKSYIFLDLLKCYGFFYATDSGTSISIEDLKVSSKTFSLLNNLKKETLKKAQNWKKGYLSEKDRFDFIMNSWAEITEDIKDDIVQYFEIFDPLNSLFIMSNSGARGNMSQVRQLIGVRGLMSDQEGNVINVPVNACFKNGLNPVDYIISAYGARKGVVDTAVKTAAAGYLTRRLIFLARNFLIKQIDCKGTNGLLVNISKTKDEILYGYTLLDIYKKNKRTKINLDNLITFKGKIVDREFLSCIRSKKYCQNILIKIRSVLTCNISSSLCQKCYGLDYSTNELVTLGEVVGIIAAQSIGEPGTQLTMRTFHTGGVFSIQKIKESKKKITGKILLKNFNIKKVFKKRQILKKDKININTITNFKALLYNHKGDEFKKLNLNSGLLPAFKFSSYIYNLDISDQNLSLDLSIQKKKLQPLILNKDYQILRKKLNVKQLPNKLKYNACKEFLTVFKQLPDEDEFEDDISKKKKLDNISKKKIKLDNISKEKIKLDIIYAQLHDNLITRSSYLFYKYLRKLRELFFYNQSEGLLLLTTGRFIDFANNYKRCYYKDICVSKKLGFSKLSSLNSGICLFENQTIILLNLRNKKLLNIKNINNSLYINKNLETIIVSHFEKFRFFDNNSDLLSFFVLPKFNKKLISFKKFGSGFFVRNIYTSFIDNFFNDKNNIFKRKKKLSSTRFNTRTKKYRKNDYKASIKIIAKNGLKYKYFKKSFMLFPKGTLLTINFLTDFLTENSLIGYFITQTIQGNDIVQGIPNVSKTIEAIKPKFPAVLSTTPGIIISHNFDLSYQVNPNDIYHIDKDPLIFLNSKNCSHFLSFCFIEEIEKKRNQISDVFQNEIIIFNGPLVKSPLISFKEKIWFCEPMQKNILLKNFTREKEKLELLFYQFISKGVFNNNVVYEFSPIKILLSNCYKYKTSYIPLFIVEGNLCFISESNNRNLLQIRTPLDLYNFLTRKNEKNLEKMIKISLIYLNDNGSSYFDDNSKKEYFTSIQHLKKLLSRVNLVKGKNEKKKCLKEIKRLYKIVNNKLVSSIFYTIKSVIIFVCKYIQYIFTIKKRKNIVFLKEIPLSLNYYIKGPMIKRIYRKNKFVNVGEPISNGSINPHDLLQAIYVYNTQHYKELNKASIYSINKFQLILLNSILGVYQDQKVKILIKHMEIMCKQLSDYVMYSFNVVGKSDPLFPGQVMERQLANAEHNVYLHKYKKEIITLQIRYSPSFISVRKSITDNGFLSSASFQNVRLVLTKGALYGVREFCSGLKDSIIVGKILSAGTNLEYKKENILSNKHFYKFK